MTYVILPVIRARASPVSGVIITRTLAIISLTPFKDSVDHLIIRVESPPLFSVNINHITYIESANIPIKYHSRNSQFLDFLCDSLALTYSLILSTDSVSSGSTPRL